MDATFAIVAALIAVSAAGAMFLRHLVHCALCLAVTFAGLAVVYLKLGAPFVGFAQVLVYVGAVAVLILFAIILTRSGEPPAGQGILSAKGWLGAGVAVAVFGVLASAVQGSAATLKTAKELEPTVRDIGTRLMTGFVLPLEALALLLTAALIGAVLIAMKETK